MQYSLRSLFIIITVLAVLCAIAVAPPHFVGAIVMGLGLLFAPPVLVSGAYYLRGNLRAFCIGGAAISFVMVPYMYLSLSFLPIYSGFGFDDNFVEVKIMFAVLWGLICFSGLLGIGMCYLSRWLYGAQSTKQLSVTRESFEHRPPTGGL